MLNIGVGVALSTCNFIITGCILEFQMDEINPGFMKSGKFNKMVLLRKMEVKVFTHCNYDYDPINEKYHSSSILSYA